MPTGDLSELFYKTIKIVNEKTGIICPYCDCGTMRHAISIDNKINYYICGICGYEFEQR
jgi:DNA-directed RNA polymerase subunit RPC12/RpoP